MKLLNSKTQYCRIFKLFQFNLRYFSITSNASTKDSYCLKNGNTPLFNLTIGEALNKATDKHGDHTVYISHHQRLSKTYSELRNEAEKLASGLIACGLRKGDRVAVYSPNCYEWPLVQLATAKAGLTAVTINFASQPLEVEHCLRKTACKSVISFDKLKHLDAYNVFNAIIPNLKTSNPMRLQIEKLPNLETLIMISEDNKEGIMRFKDVMNMGNADSNALLSKFEKEVKCNDPVNIQFTSGTTGDPKAAVLNHYSLLNSGNNLGSRVWYGSKTNIMCCQVPLFHIFGCVLTIFFPMMKKATLVIPCPTHDASQTLESIEKYRCNSVFGTPTMFIDLIKTHKTLKTDISSISQVILGGSPIPNGVLKDLFNDYKIEDIICGYGLTETSACAAINCPINDLSTLCDGFMEPVDGMEVKIVDNQSKLVPKHQQGEICIKGYSLFSGYWEDQEKTAEAIDKEGFFHTGDIGEMNDKGWIKVDGRLKDMVIRGGENIYSPEVESFLSNHPAILEVYVCGVPDERLGEELCCWISVKPGMSLSEEDIRSFCKEKISYYKIPRYIMFVEEFPKNTVGKIKKHEMTKISIEKLNL